MESDEIDEIIREIKQWKKNGWKIKRVFEEPHPDNFSVIDCIILIAMKDKEISND